MSISIWQPHPITVQKTNIFKTLQKLGFENYDKLWKWSVTERENFWKYVIETLEIPFFIKPEKILDLPNGVEQPIWLKGAAFNIVDACFTHQTDAIAIYSQKENGDIEKWTYWELQNFINQIANSFKTYQLQKGDVIAIDMPMNVAAISIYLGAIKAGLTVATIADSFTAPEIATRIEITKPKLVFTQDFLVRNGKEIPLYQKVCEANAPQTIVFSEKSNPVLRRKIDIKWSDFLSDNTFFTSVKCKPDDFSTILFSSGTTAAPKAIPWTHTTPIKCASDGYFHQDIQRDDVVAWPTNLGWMMGPWLVFATLINKASIGLYEGSPLGKEFGLFIQNAKVNMLGVVPSIVKQWKISGCMEYLDWSAIKCFSSTGEASNPEEYSYLMKLAGVKPIIEYCGGTEIGGGYLCSTLVQKNMPSTFSTKALGSDFVLLDENHQEQTIGEVFLIPPTLGLSNTLLNKNHHQEYYEGIGSFKGQILRRHGDQMLQLENGYFKAQGRVDDAMNLGGIKVSSQQIEELIYTLDFVKECAAVAISPDDGGPENLLVYYVPSIAIPTDHASKMIREIVKNELNPLFKVHQSIAIEKLPRTDSGKIMRKELRKFC